MGQGVLWGGGGGPNTGGSIGFGFSLSKGGSRGAGGFPWGSEPPGHAHFSLPRLLPKATPSL